MLVRKVRRARRGCPAIQQCELDLHSNWNCGTGWPAVGSLPGGRSSLIETRRWNKRVIGRSDDERGNNAHLRRSDRMQMAHRAAIVIVRSLVLRRGFLMAVRCSRMSHASIRGVLRSQYRPRQRMGNRRMAQHGELRCDQKHACDRYPERRIEPGR